MAELLYGVAFKSSTLDVLDLGEGRRTLSQRRNCRLSAVRAWPPGCYQAVNMGKRRLLQPTEDQIVGSTGAQCATEAAKRTLTVHGYIGSTFCALVLCTMYG